MLKQAAHPKGERERMWWRWVYISSNVDVQKAVLARARLKRLRFGLQLPVPSQHRRHSIYQPPESLFLNVSRESFNGPHASPLLFTRITDSKPLHPSPPHSRSENMSTPPSITPTQLTQALTTLGLPTPHPSFLAPILTPGASQRLPPLAALTATAKLRLLNADFTSASTLDASRTLALPTRITDPNVVSLALDADVPVQVVGVEDLGRSKWDQVEVLERERKGEFAKGREVIRVIPAEGEGEGAGGNGNGPSPAAAQRDAVLRSNGPFKLLMEDIKGQRVYGFELKRVEKIGYPPLMSIGCKIVLKKGTKVARGMVLLEPSTVVVLGGKMEALDKKWREGREKELRDAAGEGRRGGNGGNSTSMDGD
jgi:RecQ-mediated genome instability protein 1